MFGNFFKFFLSNLRKRKIQFIVVTTGLSISLVCYIFSTAFLWDEVNYDLFNRNSERIFRITTTIKNNDELTSTAFTAFPLASTLQQDVPDIETSTHLLRHENVRVKVDTHLFNEEKFYTADKNISLVFTLNFIKGNPGKALESPLSVVLTESLANKYFKSVDCISKVIKIDDQDYQVTGVISDLPQNSDIQPSALISYDQQNSNDWMDIQYYTYVLLKPSSNIDKHTLEGRLIQVSNQNYNGKSQNGTKYKLSAQPLKDIHFSEQLFGDTSKGNKTTFFITAGLGIIILILAVINFTSIVVTNSSYRLKEVGVKKTLGASNFHIACQFVGESILIMLFATTIAVVLVIFLTPFFNQITNKEFVISSLLNSRVILSLFFAITAVIIISALYPTIMTAKFNIAWIFNGHTNGTEKNYISRIFLAVQFTFSLTIVICTTFMYYQINFISKKDLGFDKDNVIVVEIPYDTNHFAATNFLKRNLISQKFISSASIGSYSVPGAGFASKDVSLISDGKTQNKIINIYNVDENFIDLLNIKVIAGRNFNDEKSDYRNKCLINVECAQNLGFGNALEKCIGMQVLSDTTKYEVIGVVNSFNYGSLLSKVEPLILFYNVDDPYEIFIKPNSNAGIGEIRNLWQQSFSEYPLIYSYLDETLAKQYKRETTTKNILLGLSIVSIVLCYFGLYAMASSITKMKLKQMAIRKVFGANSYDLFYLFINSFVWNYLISFILAISLSILFLNKWLSNFVYKIPIDFLTFIIIGLMGFTILMAVISNQLVTVINVSSSKLLRNK